MLDPSRLSYEVSDQHLTFCIIKFIEKRRDIYKRVSYSVRGVILNLRGPSGAYMNVIAYSRGLWLYSNFQFLTSFANIICISISANRRPKHIRLPCPEKICVFNVSFKLLNLIKNGYRKEETQICGESCRCLHS